MTKFYDIKKESKYLNCDCLEVLKNYPDNYFDLAIVDPPYGDGKGGNFNKRFRGHFDKYKSVKRTGGGYAKKYGKDIDFWDEAPTKEYFDELFRVSKNQIIWGSNYFDLPPTRGFIVWEKLTISEHFSMAMAEYAWMSYQSNSKIVKLRPQGKPSDPRFHPTQKPIELYEWILNRYAKQGDLILDTHVGSASSLIACKKLGFNYLGCEISKKYYEKGLERISKQKEKKL